MNEWVRDELIDALEPHQVAEIAGEMETDDAVAIIEEMEEDDQRAVLRALDPDDRAAIEEALGFPEESAGRLMQRDLIAVPEHWTVGRSSTIFARARSCRPTSGKSMSSIRRTSRSARSC
jgi:magnesium transporter